MKATKFDKLTDVFAAEGERGALRQIMDAADEVFYTRHPELRGQRLEKSSSDDLRTEWAEIFKTQTRLAMIALGADAKLLQMGA